MLAGAKTVPEVGAAVAAVEVLPGVTRRQLAILDWSGGRLVTQYAFKASTRAEKDSFFRGFRGNAGTDRSLDF